MSDTVFFSFVLFLGSQWGAEPHSISVTKGVENSFSSGSEHPDEDLAKLFDEILLQVFPSNLDDVSKDARTAGRLLTWGDERKQVYASESKPISTITVSTILNLHPVCISKRNTWLRYLMTFCSRCFLVTPNIYQEKAQDQLTDCSRGKTRMKIILLRRLRSPPLVNRDVENQLTTGSKRALQRNSQDAHAESLPCRQLLSFLQKNIVIAASAMAAILLVTVLVVLVVVTNIRRKRSRNPPASMTYNIFIMNGKAWWQKSQEKHLRKFTGKQRPMNSNSSI